MASWSIWFFVGRTTWSFSFSSAPGAKAHSVEAQLPAYCRIDGRKLTRSGRRLPRTGKKRRATARPMASHGDDMSVTPNPPPAGLPTNRAMARNPKRMFHSRGTASGKVAVMKRWNSTITRAASRVTVVCVEKSRISRQPAGGPATASGVAGSSPTGSSWIDGLGAGDIGRLARDQTWFIAIFVVKVAPGLVAFAFKPWLGLLFFAAYAVYFWREMSADGEKASHEDLAPLKLQPRSSNPATWAVVVQTLATVAVIFGASRLFVAELEWAGPALGLSPLVTALLLSPIATELPEVLNAIIWVRQGKTRLALANICGAMMI